MSRIITGIDMEDFLRERDLTLCDSIAIIIDNRSGKFLKIKHANTPHLNEINFSMAFGEDPRPEKCATYAALEKIKKDYNFPNGRGFSVHSETDFEDFGENFIPLFGAARIFCTSFATEQEYSSKYCMVLCFPALPTRECISKKNFFETIGFGKFDPFENYSPEIKLMEGNCHDPISGDNEDFYINMRLWIN